MSTKFQRARRPEQKEARRAHLLATARTLLEGGVAPRDLALNELARQAGMAKANVYRYFETREALLVALLWDEWRRWHTTFEAEASRGRWSATALPELAHRLARSLARRPLLCALTAMVPSVLEQNLSEEAIGVFKHETLRFLTDVAARLAQVCPLLEAPAYARWLLDGVHCLVALYPATHPAPAVGRVLADPALRIFASPFVDELTRFLTALALDHQRRTPLEPPASRKRTTRTSRP